MISPIDVFLAVFTGIPWFHWLLPLALFLFVYEYHQNTSDNQDRYYVVRSFWGSALPMLFFTYFLYVYTPISAPLAGMIMFLYSSILAIVDYAWVERTWVSVAMHISFNLVSGLVINSVMLLGAPFVYPTLFSVLIALHGRYNVNVFFKFFLGTRRYMLVLFQRLKLDKYIKRTLGKSKWIIFKYYFVKNFDWVLFTLVLGGVYYQCRRKAGKKTDFEAVSATMEKEGITISSCFRIFGIALKVGSAIAGLAELGTHLLPRDIAFTSIVGDLFKFVSELFADETKTVKSANTARLRQVSVHDLDPNTRYIIRQRDGEDPRYFVVEADEEEAPEELGGDLQEVEGFIRKLKRNMNGLLQIIYKHRMRISVIALAAMLGATLYLYVHKPHLFRRIHVSVQFEGKGKTKKGRGAMKVTNAKKRKPFIIYEDEAIAAMFVDGKEVDISEFINTELRPGKYEIWRAYPAESGYTLKSEFFEVVENQIDAGYEDRDGNGWEPAYNHLFFRVRGNVDIKPQQFVTVDNRPTTTRNDVNAPVFVDGDTLTIPETTEYKHTLGHKPPNYESESDPDQDRLKRKSKGKEPVHEAVLPSSPLFKTEVVKQFVYDLLDEDKQFIQGGFVTNKGLICNRHSIDRVRYIRKNDKTFELPLKDGKVEYDPKSLGNSDIIRAPCVNSIDGLSRARGKIFADPEVGQKVTIVRNDGRVSVGQILTIHVNENSDQEVTYSISTEEGDCGLPIINTNGQVVAIHFAKADTKSNRGAPCNERFKTLFQRSAPAIAGVKN